jgi:hypothetical protein
VLEEVARMENPGPSRWMRVVASLGVVAAAVGAFVFTVQVHLAQEPREASTLGDSSAPMVGESLPSSTALGGMEMLAAWSDLNNDTQRLVSNPGARALLNEAYADVILEEEKEADHGHERAAGDVRTEP